MTPRTCITLFVAVSAVALSSCKDWKERNREGPTVTGRTIHLKDITFTTGGAGSSSNYYQVQGSFTFGMPKAGEQSILTEGYGGACLLQQQNKLCSGAQDKDKGAVECSPPTEGWGYCLDRKLLPQGKIVGQCWIKGKYDCLRAPRENDGKLLAEGQTYHVPKESRVSVRRPAKVRMVACVNGLYSSWTVGPDGLKQPPCALDTSNNRITIVGPILSLPAP